MQSVEVDLDSCVSLQCEIANLGIFLKLVGRSKGCGRVLSNGLSDDLA